MTAATNETHAPVRWGYLGAGNIARKALVPAAASIGTAEVVAIAARDRARAQALVPGARAYDDYASLLDDADVEAVYISLTNELHLPWARRALEAGKHVLCEKPLAMDPDEVATMIDVAATADRLLVEAVWNRWHPRTARLIELLGSGRFGTPRDIDTAFAFRGVAPDNFRWMPDRGGGALYDLGAYALASALWTTGWPPVDSVEVDVRWSDSGVDASTRAVVRLGGAVAHVHVSIDDDAYQRLVVVTDRGRVELSAPVFTTKDEVSTLTARLDDGSEELVEHFPAVDPYALMLDHVSRAIRGDSSAWLLPLDESVRMAELIAAVRAASGSPS